MVKNGQELTTPVEYADTPGIREQIKDGWIQYYSGALSVSLLQDYLMSIFFGRSDESQRSVKLMTGTLGSILFHNALAAVANGFLTVDSHWIRSASNPGSPTPGLAYGKHCAPCLVVILGQ